MTAIGNVMALIRELEGGSADAVGGPATRVFDLPPPDVNVSSLGEVLALIRILRDEDFGVTCMGKCH